MSAQYHIANICFIKEMLLYGISGKNIKYEEMIRFEKPIDINAQCDNRGGYNVFQYYGETSSFPLVGFVIFKESKASYKYDYGKIKL